MRIHLLPTFIVLGTTVLPPDAVAGTMRRTPLQTLTIPLGDGLALEVESFDRVDAAEGLFKLDLAVGTGRTAPGSEVCVRALGTAELAEGCGVSGAYYSRIRLALPEFHRAGAVRCGTCDTMNEVQLVEVSVVDASGARRLITAPIGYAEYTGFHVPTDRPDELSGLVDPDAAVVRQMVDSAQRRPEWASGNTWDRVVALGETLPQFHIHYLPDPDDGPTDGTWSLAHAQAPTETAWIGGDCEDLAVLFASLLAAASIDARIVLSADHAMVGVGISSGAVPPDSGVISEGSKEFLVVDPMLIAAGFSPAVAATKAANELQSERWSVLPRGSVAQALSPLRAGTLGDEAPVVLALK